MTIAVLTFKRPAQLSHLLSALHPVIRESSDLADVRVLVVDNDPTESGRAPTLGEFEFGLTYVVEAKPGIAAARNRALDECGDSSLLVFIDDDELPRAGWLRALIETWKRTGASAVTGQVVSVFEEEIDPWILAGGYFQRPTYPTGTQMHAAATNNLLLDMDFVRAVGVRFDESLGLGGGEDSLFTSGLVRAGGKIVWCQDAIVDDPVPPERATRAWVSRRAFSHGHVFATVSLKLAKSKRRQSLLRLRWVIEGLGRLGVGVLRFGYGKASSRLRHEVRGHRGVLRGRGMIQAALGIPFSEYARSAGPGNQAIHAKD